MWPVDPGISQAPPAKRASAPGWRDPRLWLGVAIVAASMFAGSLVLGTSDETVAVWAATEPLAAGHVLTAGDVTVRRVRFDDSGASGLYLPADRELPADLRLSRAVGAGELVPKAAAEPTAGRDERQVPVSVAPGQVPPSVGVGDVVDVYVRPSSRTGCADSGVCDGSPVVAAVTVLEAPDPGEGLGSDGSRMLVLAMSGAQTQRFFRAVASVDDAAVTVVGRG
jgi:hypothetical protein